MAAWRQKEDWQVDKAHRHADRRGMGNGKCEDFTYYVLEEVMTMGVPLVLGVDRMGDDGSDHAVFVQHLGVAGTATGFQPSNYHDYPTYHSVLDDYLWMSKFGDPGFKR